MRKVKSTALLGAFVAVASVGVISHEAHGAQITTPNGTPTIISKEMLPNSSATFKAFIIPSVGFSGSSITLTISGASFSANGASYTISNGSAIACQSTPGTSLTNSLTFNNCTVSANTAYEITGPSTGSNPYFSVSVPQSSSSIVLYYSSNGGDTPASATIAEVQQQLTVTPNNAVTALIDPSSLSTFTNGSSSALNYVVLSNNEYGNNSTWSNTINVNASNNISYTMNFVFTGIPGSVSSVSVLFNGSSATPVNGSVTVSSTLISVLPPFSSSSSATLDFSFSNSNNVDISTGTISLSSITGSGLNGSGGSVSYTYFSGSQNFLTFALGGTQIYIPDALAHSGSNVITDGYITISMPSSAYIASISVLNNPSASCPTNGILTSTSTPNLYYIDLNTLASLCTGLNPDAWQSGVPLVIYISGTNASASNITADAYAVFNGMLKRIPVNVVNVGSGYANFSY